MFEGKVAVVTGGCRGIGAAITECLAEGGAHVAAGYNRGKDGAEALAEAQRAKGLSVSVHQGNVAEPDSCHRVVEEVLEQQGRIDFLINNAGINLDKTVRKMTVEEWHAVLRVNLSGGFYMVKAVLNHMIERGSGRIVNISSVIGQVGNIGQANYAASKSGQFGFTKSLALEVARKGITVNCMAPGFIETEMVAAMPEKVLRSVIDRVPVGRLGQATDVARCARVSPRPATWPNSSTRSAITTRSTTTTNTPRRQDSQSRSSLECGPRAWSRPFLAPSFPAPAVSTSVSRSNSLDPSTSATRSRHASKWLSGCSTARGSG